MFSTKFKDVGWLGCAAIFWPVVICLAILAGVFLGGYYVGRLEGEVHEDDAPGNVAGQ